MADVAAGENPAWVRAKNDAARLVDEAMTEYEHKSMGTRQRPDDPNLYVALQGMVADALFLARQK